MANKPRRPRSVVFLISYSGDGSVIKRLDVSYDDYYDGTTPVIDSDTFRAEHGVRRLKGEIYDSSGAVTQSFDMTYDASGDCSNRRIVFANGKIVDGPP